MVVRTASVLLAGCLLSASMAASASAQVIYSDSFNRTGALDGSTPDVGGGQWLAGSGWSLDGAEAVIPASTSNHSFLPFTPEPGHVYCLSATLNPIGSTSENWFALGFLPTLGTNPQGTGISFHEGARTPGPWLLKRHNGGVQSFGGPGTQNAASHDEVTPGQPTRVTLRLDTTGPNWQAIYLVDNVLVRTFEYTTNPTINWIAFGVVNGNETGSVDDFELRIDDCPLPAPDGPCEFEGSYCDRFVAGAFQSPMGMRRTVNSTLPLKFDLLFDGEAVTTQAAFDQLMVDLGLEGTCIEVLVFDVTNPAQPTLVDAPEDNTGPGDNPGTCFDAAGSSHWNFNLQLHNDAFLPNRTYEVKVKIGASVLSPGNGLFQTR